MEILPQWSGPHLRGNPDGSFSGWTLEYRFKFHFHGDYPLLRHPSPKRAEALSRACLFSAAAIGRIYWRYPLPRHRESCVVVRPGLCDHSAARPAALSQGHSIRLPQSGVLFVGLCRGGFLPPYGHGCCKCAFSHGKSFPLAPFWRHFDSFLLHYIYCSEKLFTDKKYISVWTVFVNWIILF